MISTESFSKEWIVRRSEELGYNNKQLLEKVIRAFALLEMLVDAGAPVIFKGGSSLLLILKDTLNRLSIDVDVICPPGVDIRGYLKNLEEHGFLSIIPRFQPLTAGDGKEKFLEIISPNKNKMLYSWRNNFRSHERPNHRKRE